MRLLPPLVHACVSPQTQFFSLPPTLPPFPLLRNKNK
jgi:hypothetical protein